MDDAHAMIAKAAWWKSLMNPGLIANEKKFGDGFVGLERPFCALDNDTAAVVASHHIHRDSHSLDDSARKTNFRAGADLSPRGDGQHLAAFIISARGTYPVGNIRGVALRTFA